MTPDVILYHGGCPDGFACYVIVKRLFPEVVGISCSHSPTFVFADLLPQVTGKNVVMCDFSFARPQLDTLISVTASFLLIDHHVSAQTALADLPDQYKIFDQAHCGAVLTWHHFYPGQPVPLLLQYVEDRDLWRKQLPSTDEVSLALHSFRYNFDKWVLYLEDEKIPELMSLGSTFQTGINEYLSSKLTEVKIEDGVGYVESASCQSELGNLMMKRLDLKYAVVYSFDGLKSQFSLRSLDNKTDVSQVAQTYGGGGHRNASGVQVMGYATRL